MKTWKTWLQKLFDVEERNVFQKSSEMTCAVNLAVLTLSLQVSLPLIFSLFLCLLSSLFSPCSSLPFFLLTAYFNVLVQVRSFRLKRGESELKDGIGMVMVLIVRRKIERRIFLSFTTGTLQGNSLLPLSSLEFKFLMRSSRVCVVRRREKRRENNSTQISIPARSFVCSKLSPQV